jgi:hypothetical protein
MRPRAIAAVAGAALGVIAAVVDELSPRPFTEVLADKHPPLADAAVAWSVALASVVEMAALLVFLYAAAANVHALGRKGLRFTPFTTVAWWFLPFVNLYMPYRALREAWLATDGDDFAERRPPARLLLWWLTMWLSVWPGVVGVVLTAVSAALLTWITFDLARRQDDVASTTKPAEHRA